MRDFLYVEDMASAMWAVAKSGLSGPVNVGSGQAIKVRTLVETVAQYLQCEQKLALGALPTDARELPLVVADVRRLASVVGWKPSLTLKEGVAKTCEWWRSRVGSM